MTRTATEQFVLDVCQRSFLSLWSYPNPQGRTAGRELCDILVVCDPDVIIISVKEILTKESDPDEVRFRKWVRKAVDESAAQIYGAERWINSGRHVKVVREDGTLGLLYPETSLRRVHRVAVALGGEKHFPVPFGDFAKGFVHVFDQRSFEIVTGELDTITDFVGYLRAKEDFFAGERDVIFGKEEDVLAIFLHQNRTFPTADFVIVEDGAWEKLTVKAEFRAKNIANQKSYKWDWLIELISGDVLAGNLEFSSAPAAEEVALRVLARESRFERRMLGQALADFLDASRAKEIRARISPSPSGVTYVFLATPDDGDREVRNEELALRCFVARHKTGATKIIGLATEQPGTGVGSSWSLLYLEKPEWTEENSSHAEGIMKDLGYFASPREIKSHEDEYPGTCEAPVKSDH